MARQTSIADMWRDFREALHRLLFETIHPPRLYFLIDRLIMVLVILSVVVNLLEHVPKIHALDHALFETLDQVIIGFFALEYLGRVLSGGLLPHFRDRPFATIRYLLTPMALVDLIVILPYLLVGVLSPDLLTLRAVRLLRLFKFGRVMLPKWRRFQKLNAHRTLRQTLHSALNHDEYSADFQGVVDAGLVMVITLSIIAVILESVPSIHEAMPLEFHYFDLFSVIVFSVEYGLRIYSAPENPDYQGFKYPRWHYVTSITAIIDLIAILPFYLSFFVQADLRFFRVIRLLRVLKLTRYSSATSTILEVIKEESPSLIASFFVLFMVTIMAASLMYLVEHDSQPDKFGSIPLALYWAIITLSSIGYGDVVPVTALGKFLTMIIALAGLGLISLPTGILAMGFSEKLRQRSEQFKAMVDAKARGGVLSAQEEKALDQDARALGLTEEQRIALEQEELRRLDRAPGLQSTDASHPGNLLSGRDIDSLATEIRKLPPDQRAQLIALLALHVSEDLPKER